MTNQKRKRIIIDGEVLVTPHFSGIGHYTLELLRGIDRQLVKFPNFKVRLLVYYKQLERARSFNFTNIKLIPTPIPLRISNGLKIRGKQPPLDLLFGRGTYIFPNFTSWPLLTSKSIPIIYDLSYEKYPQFAEPRNQKFLSDQVKRATARADMIGTISKNSRKEISEFYGYPLRGIRIYYPAVDTKHFYTRSPKEIAKTKQEYGITANKYILFVGNIEPRKNLKNLILAYAKLPTELTDSVSLLLIGAKGWQDDEITETMKRLRRKGVVIQTPNKRVSDEDLPAFYSGATLFIYPSMYEGFGIPPLEAMACGAAVICANNSSLPEAAGNAALYVNALSVDDIANTIKKALLHPEIREQLIAEGYKQITRFSWDNSARQLLDDIGGLH